MKDTTKARFTALRNKSTQVSAVLATALYAGSASAALDVSAAATEISGQSSNVETIALAVIGVLAVIAGVAYVRRVIK